MTKLLNNSNRTRNRRKKTADRVKAFRNRQKIREIENKALIRGEDGVYALFDAYANSQEEFDELCKRYEEEAKNSSEISYMPKIDLLDIWNKNTGQ